MTVRREVRVVNRQGLHARPSTRLVEIANRYSSQISIHATGQTANAKSVISVLTLGVLPDTPVVVEADGADEAAAVEALCVEISRGFGLLDEER